MEVIYEDNHIIAVNKTCREIVQGDKTGDTPLSDMLKAWLKEKYWKCLCRRYASSGSSGQWRRVICQDEQGARPSERDVPGRRSKEDLLGDREELSAGRRGRAGELAGSQREAKQELCL